MGPDVSFWGRSRPGMRRKRWAAAGERDGGGGGTQILSFETITMLGLSHAFPNLTALPLPPPVLIHGCT